MNGFQELDMVRVGFCALVVFSVITHVYQEITGLLQFASRTMGKSNYCMTLVRRREFYVFGTLIAVTILAMLAFAFSGSKNHIILVPLTALLFGFLTNVISSGVCFINDIGLGSASLRSEMEIQWNEISDYRWENNVLYLRQKRRRPMAIRFTDSAAILLVNERLHQNGSRTVSMETAT